MAATGCCLVASAPVGPVQQPGYGHGPWLEDGDEQVTDRKDGESNRVTDAGGAVRIDGLAGGRVGCYGCQEGQDKHGQRDVPVP